ncbi:hypothetical protein Dda_4170 [Drechslerella dactyloides]|uniref:F-box domain-containing protein n=1 Tax=Drechslerella dactyloides TaxID=74499 RepID=A0AAD6IZB4_DREDA|nr:hypothetical protein Dda_4170 [Drechslerella dactyloides]
MTKRKVKLPINGKPLGKLMTFPEEVLGRIINYLPLPSIVALCHTHEKFLRVVCEQNRDSYFGYRKNQAQIFMPAILNGHYNRFVDEGETLVEHALAAKELAGMICYVLGRNR